MDQDFYDILFDTMNEYNDALMELADENSVLEGESK